MDRSGVLIVAVGCVLLAAGGSLIMVRNAQRQAAANEQEAATLPPENSEPPEAVPIIEPIPAVPPVTAAAPTEPAIAPKAASGVATGTIGDTTENTSPIDASNPQNVVRSMGPDFRRCYNQGLVTNPNMKGSMRITARLGPTGRVVVANSSGGNGLSQEVIACVVNRVKNAQFSPPEGGGATIVIPVNFTSQ